MRKQESEKEVTSEVSKTRASLPSLPSPPSLPSLSHLLELVVVSPVSGERAFLEYGYDGAVLVVPGYGEVLAPDYVEFTVQVQVHST